MKSPIIISCRFNTEETALLEKMEMDYSPDILDEKDVYFYNVEAVYETTETHKGVTNPIVVIWSGGCSFETTMRLWEVLKLINEQKS